MTEVMRILAISGSLRDASSNTALLMAAARVAPRDVEVVLYRGQGSLPHFSPDIDHEPADAAVAEFRTELHAADGIVISSPEYAHGVPGTLKNALDWVVGSGELVEKPVILMNASPRSVYAQASLAETLRVMSADFMDDLSVTVQVPGKSPSFDLILADDVVAGALRAGMARFVEAVRARKTRVAAS